MNPDRELHMAEGEMLLVKKPAGWTSFDVVNRIRGIFHVQRVGHSGTLDPMATGLLIVCTGKKTKELDSFIGLEKEYDATMVLGASTSSFDGETPVTEYHSIDDITEEGVRAALTAFVGHQTQLPPMWSAAKVLGKPLYKYARKGLEIERKPREVFVASIEPTTIQLPEVSFTVVCSKGTYVRGLVDSIGKRLGCGAYLKSLERTRIGNFLLSDAISIEDLARCRVKHQFSLS